METVMTERDLLQAYVEARRELEALSESLKESRAKYDQAEAALVEALIANDATATAKYEGLGFVSLQKPALFAAYSKEQEGKVFQFIRDNGMDSIIKPTVHHKSLSGFVSALVEEGKQVPEFISYYMKQGVKFFSR
jgi:predicted 2-oxoglutarate/Fe(II)-dependent dioxygenase YbiX